MKQEKKDYGFKELDSKISEDNTAVFDEPATPYGANGEPMLRVEVNENGKLDSFCYEGENPKNDYASTDKELKLVDWPSYNPPEAEAFDKMLSANDEKAKQKK